MEWPIAPMVNGLLGVSFLMPVLLGLSDQFSGAADPASHKIYIWDISNDGRFVSTLDGGREPLVHLHVGRTSFVFMSFSYSDIWIKQWHPSKSSIVSTTNQGNVLIWHNPNPERWGAFAGGFEEVDENVEYEEREDEFDIVRHITHIQDTLITCYNRKMKKTYSSGR